MSFNILSLLRFFFGRKQDLYLLGLSDDIKKEMSTEEFQHCFNKRSKHREIVSKCKIRQWTKNWISQEELFDHHYSPSAVIKKNIMSATILYSLTPSTTINSVAFFSQSLKPNFFFTKVSNKFKILLACLVLENPLNFDVYYNLFTIHKLAKKFFTKIPHLGDTESLDRYRQYHQYFFSAGVNKGAESNYI